jgi:hypothetical protein
LPAVLTYVPFGQEPGVGVALVVAGGATVVRTADLVVVVGCAVVDAVVMVDVVDVVTVASVVATVVVTTAPVDTVGVVAPPHRSPATATSVTPRTVKPRPEKRWRIMVPPHCPRRRRARLVQVSAHSTPRLSTTQRVPAIAASPEWYERGRRRASTGWATMGP